MPRGRPRKVYESIFAPEIDWGRIMAELEGRGITPYRVAQHLGVSPCTAINWGKGGEPCYSNGFALLKLHSIYIYASTSIYSESMEG